MTKKLERSATLAIVIVACALGSPRAQTVGKPSVVQAEDYAVYAAAMKEIVGGRSFVVMDTTWVHGGPENLDRTLPFIEGRIGPLPDDLRDDFRDKNRQRYLLAPHFPGDVQVRLLSESDRSAIFADSLYQTKEHPASKDSGWEGFYSKYAGASGITTVSRVGFSRQGDTALVCVSNVRHYEAGGGWCVLLTKQDGTWKVVRKATAWIT